VVGQGLRAGPNVPERVRASRGEPQPPPPRRAYFGSWIETPVMRRSDLSQAKKGPLIVEEYDATCVVPPGAKAQLDAGGNIVIELG
jgi:N-methylhydantoinase A